mgnify:FL=1
MKLCIELALMYSPILLKIRFFAPTFSKVTETQVSFTDFVISVSQQVRLEKHLRNEDTELSNRET